MNIIHSQIKKFNVPCNFIPTNVKYLDQKIVIFESSRNVRIINIELTEQDDAEDQVLTFNDDIVSNAAQDRLLWLVLESSEIVAIDLLNCGQIKVQAINPIAHKIHQLKNEDNKVIMINENDDHFSALVTSEEILEKIKEGLSEITVPFDKIPKTRSTSKVSTIEFVINGLNASIESSNLVIKCPVTGLSQTICADINIQHIVPWENFIILMGSATMWIIDLTISQIAYVFKSEADYYPLSVDQKKFYYLSWNKTMVNIYCAWITTTTLTDSHEDSISRNSTPESSQEALKLKLKSLLDIALSAPKTVKVMNQLHTLSEKIDDISFLLNSASKLCQHDINYKSLLYSLQKRVTTTSDNNLINSLYDLLNKIDLIEYINFRCNTSYENVKLFQQNFIQLLVTFISKSDIDLASICWLKYSELKLSILPEDIVQTLEVVPHNIKMSALIIWLKNFIPPLLNRNPFYIDLFVRWTTKRIFNLEKSRYWPKVGINFLDEIIHVLESSLETIALQPISMDDLRTLKTHILYIIELKDKYKINMLLGELSSQSPSEVALIMLHRCYTEDLEGFLQDCLPAYATRHAFELDNTLRSFIENDAASSGGNVDGSRLQILLNAFRSPTNKLDCLLQVLRMLDVPWNTTVTDLAIAAAASPTKDFTITEADRALALEIQNELNYAKVKMVLKKYNFPLTCIDYTLVLHKIVNAVPIDVNDLKAITNIMTSYKNYGSILYIDRCLQDYETKVALDYFNRLSGVQQKILFKAITVKFEQIINNNDMDITIARNYWDFIKGTHMLNEVETNTIEKLYHLKNLYGIKSSMNNMFVEELCPNNFSAEIANPEYSGDMIPFAHSQQLQIFTIITLLRHTSVNHKARKLVEAFIMSFSNEENLTTENIVTTLSHFKDGSNTKLLLDSCNILVELVANCHQEQIHLIVKCLSILNSLLNTSIVAKNLSAAWKFHYIFLPMSSVIALNDLIDFYVVSRKSFESDFTNICIKNDCIAFRIIANILLNTFNSGKQSCQNYIEKREVIIKKLLMKIVTSQDVDHFLLSSLLLLLNRDEDMESGQHIIETLKGQNEILPPAIGYYLSSPLIRHLFKFDNVLLGNIASCPPYLTLKTKFNVNLTEISLPDITEETWDAKVVLFYVLKEYPRTTFERLVDLCRTLNVSVNYGLSLQLVSLLTTWDLKYKIINDDLGCRQIYLENDESEIISNCFTIWENINNKDFLKDILSDFWENGDVTLHGRVISINPYYYEVYMCIYRLIFASSTEQRKVKEYFLLNFLKNYKRKSTPKQYEFELFSVKGMFPEIGNYRLPFHLFMRNDMWSNLKSEITLETYEHWLPAVALLSLDADTQTARDMICSNALKQTMTSRKRSDNTEVDSKESESWRLTTQEEPLLRAAHRCVKHIANMEWAGACLFYVLQGCARGADQVAAAQLCYQFAQRWAALQPGNRAVRQMERLHSTLSTRHALHKIEWACEELARLSTEPVQLIRTLYLHPAFIDKISRHDINRAVNEIADKNDINVSSIRIQILENLLEKSNGKDENKNFTPLDTRELTTAKYILKATCPKMGAIYLSRIAFDDDSDFNKCKKLRALQCLMSVVEPETAMKVTNRERETLWISLLDLLYIVNLERIDMHWIIATFTQDKKCALEQMIQAVGGNCDGLKLAAEIAHRFGDEQIIRSLLPLLLRAGIYEKMIPLLLKITAPPDDTISTAWRAIILSPFQRADYPITERQKTNCLNAINLLPICPILKDEDLVEIWKNCIRCKCFGIGCLVLPYIPPQLRKTLPELAKVDKRTLIANLKNLQTETYLVSGAMYVVENVGSKAYR